MQVFDASAIVYAWDNYPRAYFGPLWDWMGKLVEEREIVFASIALEEVGHVSPDCRAWLTANKVEALPVTPAIVQLAQQFKGHIGVADDNFHADGVDENDLFIIATAKDQRVTLVSNERVQTALPNSPRKYKIPAVCQLAPVGVSCLDYLGFLHQMKPKLY